MSDTPADSAGFGIAVVLVEPRIPQNVGNIARLCACMGLPLVLVGDLGFRFGDKFLARAGMDYLERAAITHVPDMEALTAKYAGWQAFYVSTKAAQAYTAIDYGAQIAESGGVLLVFGREDRGLPDWVMAEHPEWSIRIPMVAGARSLNVSSAVAMVVGEVMRQVPLHEG